MSDYTNAPVENPLSPEAPTEVKTNTEQPFVSTQTHATDDQFRLLVEAVKDYGIFMLDPAGNVSSWNPGAEKSEGYKDEEIIGKHISCFYSAEDVAAGEPERILRIALNEGRFEEEGLRLRKGGVPFWAIVTLTNIHDALGQHIGFANVTRDITERKKAEDRLRMRDRAIESFAQGLILTDPALPDNPIIHVNDSFLRITGYNREDVIGKNCRFLQGPKTSVEAVARVRHAIGQGQPCLVEMVNYRKDGTSFWNALSISPIFDLAGKVMQFVGVVTDISPMKLLEQQFHQSQKMEAIGQLAGGVAHDFNNLLTIISGYSELLLGMLPENDPKRDAVRTISEAGERAAGLTRQLLFFSRRAMLETKVIDINDIVKETKNMLRRMIGEDILVTAVLDPNIRPIKADPGQLVQILMNLAVNSRDAMPQGGKFTIETSNVQLDEVYATQHADCQPGPHIKLSISDNGCGMTSEVKAHVFEPFFTTKGPGKGTGLGLATVYGIIKQNGGSIDLYSEVGHGTTFKIFFPVIDEPLHNASNPLLSANVLGGKETILLVEDEDAVRTVALLALQTRGYTVLHAENGRSALRIAKQHQGNIDLLVTDVVMPGISGRELAEELIAENSRIRLIYVSGYTDDAVVRNGILQADVAFLQKPYTPLAFARKVREILDQQIARTKSPT